MPPHRWLLLQEMHLLTLIACTQGETNSRWDIKHPNRTHVRSQIPPSSPAVVVAMVLAGEAAQTVRGAEVAEVTGQAEVTIIPGHLIVDFAKIWV